MCRYIYIYVYIYILFFLYCREWSGYGPQTLILQPGLRDNYADFLFPSLACAKSTRTQLRGHSCPSSPELSEIYEINAPARISTPNMSSRSRFGTFHCISTECLGFLVILSTRQVHGEYGAGKRLPTLQIKTSFLTILHVHLTRVWTAVYSDGVTRDRQDTETTRLGKLLQGSQAARPQATIPLKSTPEKVTLPLYQLAHGVVVSHPLSMREALGSIPSVSILGLSEKCNFSFEQNVFFV